jgi:outer membrane lipoprotein LolB
MHRSVLSFCLILLVAGCASLPPPVADSERLWQERRQKLAPLIDWEIRGRMALRTDTEGWHATIVWVRADDRHRIDLSGPLGRGHLRLSRDREGAELEDTDGNVMRAERGEDLLVQATGYRVPLEGLDFWVRGLPLPGRALELELDPRGRLRGLKQDGWDIEYLAYANHGDYELPSKLFLRRRQVAAENDVPGRASAAGGGATGVGEHNGDVEVRLVIERWGIK